MLSRDITLNKKIFISLILIGLISIISLVTVFQTIALQEITRIEKQVLKAKGETVVSAISQHLSSVERLVQNMAQLGENLPKRKELYFDVFPKLLGPNNENSHIAGGGIWPEPNTFNTKITRRSFFWGREQNGRLKYYNDYNISTSMGYHNEEWYVPARYLNSLNKIYWSRSYMDPYSFESMVTATAPYKDKNGNFSGVATVDVKLQGLNKLFIEHSKDINGYIFAVDRNNVFLSFPENSDIKPYLINDDGNPFGQYFTLDRFVKDNSMFSEYATHINKLRNLYSSKTIKDSSLDELSDKINLDSYQIDEAESFRIATDIQIQSANSEAFKPTLVNIEYDPILKSGAIASIHYLPKYHWFVTIITPNKTLLTKVRNTTDNIFLWVLISISIIFVLSYIILNKIIIFPLKTIEKVLEENISSNNLTPLPVSSNDEIGRLSKLFNERTNMLEKSRREANKANSAKTEFLSRMSHELRTPLNAILGFSQLLELDQEVSGRQLDNTEEITKAGKHLLLLINDLLDISKIENNIEFLNLEPLNVSTIITDVIRLTSPLQKQYDISIIINIDNDDDLSIKADKTAIKQVLINIISNAIKYNSVKGTITIDCNTNTTFLYINITDTGSGIEKHEIDHVFEPFIRLGREFSDIEGTGIGLYITKKLVEEMHGSIKLRSTMGIGSTFIIGIPLSAEKEEVYQPEKNTLLIDESNNNSNKNILIVEDILSNQKIIEKQISSFGYESDIAKNGKIALDMIEKKQYDLILTDISMPVMDGYELTNIIRNIKELSVPIIALTANAINATEQKCLDAGMSDYISKPIDINLLKEKIDKFLI